MIFNVITVFNKKNGYSDQLHICRSPKEFSEQFQLQLLQANSQNKAKNLPTLDIRDYEVRKIAEYDDEQCKVIPLDIEIIPFPPLNTDI